MQAGLGDLSVVRLDAALNFKTIPHCSLKPEAAKRRLAEMKASSKVASTGLTPDPKMPRALQSSPKSTTPPTSSGPTPGSPTKPGMDSRVPTPKKSLVLDDQFPKDCLL